MMKLCVGAASRRIVEEAAKLQVHQIVASRAQVNETGGYIGLTQRELVMLVSELSSGNTMVVRDHGGPLQGGFDDDGVESLINDANAGFDGLHLDVCKLSRADQVSALRKLVRQFSPLVPYLEIGGEHDEQCWNDELYFHVMALRTNVKYAVVSLGTYAWADKQYGSPIAPKKIKNTVRELHVAGIQAKIHNMDHIGDRIQRYGDVVDAYNLAPELGMIEVNAILTAAMPANTASMLAYAYDSSKWTRWFNKDEGTRDERARCALRYLLHTDDQIKHWAKLDEYQDEYVRAVISDAIMRG